MTNHDRICVQFLASVPHLQEFLDLLKAHILSRDVFVEYNHDTKNKNVVILFVDDIWVFFKHQRQSIQDCINMHKHVSQFIVINLYQYDSAGDPIDTGDEMLKDFRILLNDVNVVCPDGLKYMEFRKYGVQVHPDFVAEDISTSIIDTHSNRIRLGEYPEHVYKIQLTEEVKKFLQGMYDKDKVQFEQTLEETVRKVMKDRLNVALKRMEQKEEKSVLSTAAAVSWCKELDLPFTVINMTDVESVLSFHKKLDEIKDLPAITFFDTFKPYFHTKGGDYNRGQYQSTMEMEGIDTVLSLLRKRYNGDKLRTRWYTKFLSVLFDNGFYFGLDYDGPGHQLPRS